MSAPTRERASTEANRDGGRASELVTEQGKTSISDSVVGKIVGMAAQEVPGIHAMGAGLARAVGAVRERMSGGSTRDQGVAVEVGEQQAAVDLNVVVDYGVSIPDLAAGVRRSVIDTVEKMCGLEVTEVNISVEDVHVPDEGGDQTPESRVR